MNHPDVPAECFRDLSRISKTKASFGMFVFVFIIIIIITITTNTDLCPLLGRWLVNLLSSQVVVVVVYLPGPRS